MEPLQRILADDQLLAQIRAAVKDTPAAAKLARASSLESFRESFQPEMDSRLEAIVREHGRPVLYIQQGKIQLPQPPRPQLLPLWLEQIEKSRATLERRIPSIGRIELQNHPSFDWVGTGWLVDRDVVVTNRHVAREFARRGEQGFVFRRNPTANTRQMSAAFDILEEYEQGNEETFRVREVLHIEEDDDLAPDLAFLKVTTRSVENDRAIPDPIPLATGEPDPSRRVAVVGYAARDALRNPGEAMDRIFESVYDVKRVHPGEVMARESAYFTHDCSTLGGNSGSAVIDLDSGEAVGLHFAGSFKVCNYAVYAGVVRERLTSVLNIHV
jgi:endonuclease G